jgi:hypothetical protein
VQRFTDLVESTPSLRAHQRDSMDRLVAIAAEALAERAGLSPEDPEPQVAAHALIGLWRIYFLGLKRYCDGQHNPQQVADLVGQELRRAARLTDTGLWSFGVFVQGTDGTPGAQRAAMAAEQGQPCSRPSRPGGRCGRWRKNARQRSGSITSAGAGGRRLSRRCCLPTTPHRSLRSPRHVRASAS